MLAAGRAAGPLPEGRAAGSGHAGTAPALPAGRCKPGGAVPCRAKAHPDPAFERTGCTASGRLHDAAPGRRGPHPARRRKAGLCGAGCQRPFHPCPSGAGHQAEQALCAGRTDGRLCSPEPAGSVGGTLAAHGHGMAAGAGRRAVLRKPCAQRGPCSPLHRVARREPSWQPGRFCAPVRDAPCAGAPELCRPAPLTCHPGAGLLPGVRHGRQLPA